MSEFPMNSIDIEGETLEIRPRGKFGKTITEAYAELMARIAMEPLGDVVQKFVDDNPGMTLAEAQTLATKSRADEAVTKMQVGVLKVVAGTNLLYQLAGDALGKDLEVPKEKLNVNGGAVALGHPIGCTGARILTTLLYALKNRGLKKGLAALCLGGGDAMAMAVEMEN